MKLVKQTDEYIVYLKRSGRYAVKNTDREWINGVPKIQILLAEGLVETTLPPEPEAVADADEVVDDAGVAVEEDHSTDQASDSADSGTEEPAPDEPDNPNEESSSTVEVDDSAPEETTNDTDDEEDPETSTASDSSNDVTSVDNTDEDEAEATEDPEGKDP